jgi:predicted amidohydrolase
MTSKPMLCALQFAYEGRSFAENFDTLHSLVSQTPDHSIVLAPELCLSAYSYDKMEEAAAFSQTILPQLAKLSTCKVLGLSLIEKVDERYINNFRLFYKGQAVYSQAKAKLFSLGDETRYFQAGDAQEIRIIELNGIKIAILVCFELRFPSLWEQVKGADLILVPAYWGKLRKEHFETLSAALAIANQAYVLCANSADESMCRSSGIITPFGEAHRDDRKTIITHPLDFREIQKMRRYLDIGLT